MVAPAPEKDRKKAVIASAQKPAADAAKPEIAREKESLGAMLRPEVDPKGGKLEVGGKGEKAEKEADAVAEAVVKDKPAETPEKDTTKTDKKDGEEPAPGVPLARGPPALTLAVDNTVRRTTAQGGQPHLDSLSATPALPGNMAEVGVANVEENVFDEMDGADFETLGQGESLQPKFLPGHGGNARFALGAATADRIRDVRGGSALPGALRARIEDRLSVDLSGVRVHSGPQATELCAALGARAFAHGRNIWLRSASEAADTRLMAHEVVHTVQQGAARPRHRGPAPETVRRPRPETRTRHPRAPPPLAEAPMTVRRLSDEGDDGFLARQAEKLADRLDSYGVLKVLIGRRLFTGQSVNPSAVDYCGAFMKFIGADQTFEQMKQSGSLQKGFDAIREGLTTYDISWDRVKRVFNQAYDEFEWTSPIDSFTRIFAPFFSDVLAYGVYVLKIIARLVAEAFVIGFGPMGREVWAKIEAIGDTIGLIIADPLQFAMNLIRAVGNGIKGFGERIWEHIKAGLLAWILGPFAAMGITLPQTLDLKGIVSVILQVLGLTYPQLRPRIVKALNPSGEIKVSVVERIIEVVNILRTEGLVGIWRKLMEYVENLQMTVIGGIRDWVVRAVVQAGIRKLVAWSNPAGALIDILLTIYNLIVFFVERFQQILDFASSIFDSIGKIARRELGDAALAVEAAMAKTIPIIISFIVRLLGLPDIGGTIRGIITKIQAKVHKAFDRALDWIIKKVKKLIAKLVDKFRRTNPAEKKGFVMDGESHEMWIDDSQAKVRVMMASGDPHEVAENADEITDQEHTDSADYADGAAASAIDGLNAPHDALMAEKDRINRLPQPDRATPSAREKLQAKIDALTPKLEQAAVRPDNAAEIDEDNAETDITGAVKESALDRTDYPMRRRIRTTVKVEGAAGNWTAMTGVYDAAKAAAPNAADVYANLARDHIPEYALIARVSRMAKPGLTRNGGTKPSLARLFPKLHGSVPNPSPDAKKSNGLLPVIVIRTAINSQLGASSAKFAAWDANFRQDGEMWIPRTYETRLEDDARDKATTDLKTDYGAEAVISEMQGHIDELKAKYAALPENTLDDDFSAHVDANATPVLQQITRNVFGGASGDQPVAEGAQEGLNLRYDDGMAEGELQMASHKEVKSNWRHNDMQAHHVLEENIVRKLRDKANALTVGGVLGTGAETVAAQALAAAEQKLTAEQREAIAGDEAKVGQRDAARSAVTGALAAVTLDTGMRTTQGVHDNGIAINVLSSVNQLAGTQPEGNVDTTLTAAETGFRSTHGGPLGTALADPLATALTAISDGTGLDVSAVQEQLRTVVVGRSGEMNAGLSEDYRAAMGAMTTTAHKTFFELQTKTIAEIDATGDKPTIDRSAQMRQRFAGLTSQALVDANLEKWFA